MQAERYVQHIAAYQASSGWLGPDDDKDGNKYWSKSNVMFRPQSG